MKLVNLAQVLHAPIRWVMRAPDQNSNSFEEIPVAAFQRLRRNYAIRGLAAHSRDARPGFAFFCLDGLHHRGSEFIRTARARGARVIITSHTPAVSLPVNTCVIIVKDVHDALGRAAAAFFGQPLDRLVSIGITGTNGKTTTTYMLERILKQHGRRVAVIGTIQYRYNNRVVAASHTTPDSIAFHRIAKLIIHSSKKQAYLVAEVSSHALAQRRIAGVNFDQAIFTNLTQDHLDYHHTKRNYFTAKTRLFQDYAQARAVAIINVDDCYGRKLATRLKHRKTLRVMTYGITHHAHLMAQHIHHSAQGTTFQVRYHKKTFCVHNNMPGLCNVYNALAAIGSSFMNGIPIADIQRGLKQVAVPGRFERIAVPGKPLAFVDYAHTPDALRQALDVFRHMKHTGRLIVVFGCGGDRDRGKRPRMGRIATERADIAIITSDNPRSEHPRSIIRDIVRGILKKNYLCIINRKNAMKKAIELAENNDIILIAGKGHESYQLIGSRRYPCDDRRIVRSLLTHKKLR